MILMSKDGEERLLHALMCVIGRNLPETYLCLICLLNLTYCHKNVRAKLGGGQRHLLCLHCLARAHWCLRGVGVSALARE
jgi:hypothetical protein